MRPFGGVAGTEAHDHVTAGRQPPEQGRDFALAGVALFYDMDAQGKTIDPRVGAIGVSSTPVRLNQSEAALAGYQVDDETIARVASLAANDLEIHGDIHAPAAYRRALLKTLVERALRRAAELKEHA